MMRYWMSFLFLLTFLAAGVGHAETFRRSVSFEWDPIDGARFYDVELKLQKEDKSENKKFLFKAKDAVWSGKLAPGKYIMRLRARDYRGVPGEWSAPSDFNVGLESAQLKFPSAKMKIDSKEASEVAVPFSWQNVGGATRYHFEVTSEDGKFKSEDDLNDTALKVKLPVAQHYTWRVYGYNDEKIQSEAVAVGEFTVLGERLETPKIEKPESGFVREVKWQKIENASSYDVYLLKLNREKRKWEKFQTFADCKEESVPFSAAWPGGKYQAIVRAKGDLRGPSALAKQNFDVVTGDRSPASEYTALVKTSIDRVTGWYAVASYLVTQIQYSGKHPENNSTSNYNALGGTGRLGTGWFSSDSPWGFLGILDMSGFTFNGKTNTYASLEMNSVYRVNVGMRGELRLQGGVYYKELPETIGDPFTNQSASSTISAVGPHIGAEYWYSLTPKLGVQANFHVYTGMMKISTPNGEPLTPTLSTQLGFLGSYRFTPTFTGLVGYARREDKLSYKSKSSTFTTGGENNTADISGNYLNVFAEWSF
jgi:hypothetical protein